MNFPHTASIQRTQASGGKYLFTTIGASICFLQPLSPDESQVYGLTFSKSAACYFPISIDVADGDRLIINGTTYGVRGVMSRVYGSVRHKKAIVEAV